MPKRHEEIDALMAATPNQVHDQPPPPPKEITHPPPPVRGDRGYRGGGSNNCGCGCARVNSPVPDDERCRRLSATDTTLVCSTPTPARRRGRCRGWRRGRPRRRGADITFAPPERGDRGCRGGSSNSCGCARVNSPGSDNERCRRLSATNTTNTTLVCSTPTPTRRWGRRRKRGAHRHGQRFQQLRLRLRPSQ